MLPPDMARVARIAVLCPVFLGMGPVGDADLADGAPESRPSSEITVAFGGDITLSRHVGLVASRDGADRPLGEVTELAQADLAIVNLESVSADSGERSGDVTGVVPHYFRGRPEILAVLQAAGVDVVTTANTHSGDYGPDALLEQLDHLSAMGLPAPGSGKDRASACRPAYVEVDGLVLAILAFDTTQPGASAGVNEPGTCHVPLDIEPAMAELGPLIEDARTRAHVVLVAPHWGVDFESEPSDAKRTLGRLLIEAGADAVLGTHAHQLQGLETHMGRPILHDAGNLLLHFDDALEAAVFEMTLGADGVRRVELVPLIAEQGRTRRPSAAEAEEVRDAFALRSARLGTTVVDGAVSLNPSWRPAPAQGAPISERSVGSPPDPLDVPPASCVVSEVPVEAAIAPTQLGPLTLVGVQVVSIAQYWPGFITLESYWRADEPTVRPLLLSGRAGRGPEALPTWSEEQEPCDWTWPTTRWEVGAIYRDEMLLRPSPAMLSPLGVLTNIAGLGSPAPITLGVIDGDRLLAVSGAVGHASFGLPRWLVLGLVIAMLVAVTGGIVLAQRWWRSRAAMDRDGAEPFV